MHGIIGITLLSKRDMISIRELKEQDAPIYRQTRLECLANHPDEFGTSYEEENAKPELHFEQCLKSGTSDDFVFGAFDGDRCIGLCGFLREQRAKTRHRGTIVQMYVHPDYAGKGVGTALLKQAVDRAFSIDGIEHIVLAVVASNRSANVLYEKAGFVQYGFLRNYFKQQDKYWDQRLMVLNKQ